MPNVAVRLDDDLDVREPRQKRTRAAAGSNQGRKKSAKRRFFFAWNSKNVARYGAIGFSGTIALGIVVNALVLQKGHHPAPLFGQSIALGGPKPEAAKLAVKMAAKPPAPAASSTEAETPLPVAKPVETLAADNGQEGQAPTRVDVIAQLIGGGPVPEAALSAKTVLSVQKALAKLGFSVKATGTFGPQTRKALESFEKDHHLPVDGTLSHHTMRALAAASGLKIVY